MARETIELSTSSDADLVAIDGVRYRMLDADDLSMVALTRLRRATARFGEIAEKQDPTEAEAEEADALMRTTFRTIVPEAPAEVVAKLSPRKLAKVTAFFFQRLAASVRSETQTQPASPPSSGSTEGPPSHG